VQTIFRIPEAFKDDANLFREEIARFRSGALSAAEFRSFRVPMGVYEQRESDTYMLRVRFPAGGVLPEQMRALARAARKHGNGVLHVTTRQDIQVHRVLLDDVPPAFEELALAGLSTRGGGGNTVRNITACHDAGVCPDEVFDPSDHAVAVTEFLLPDPLSYQLPRKYKIAFSGCSRDCAGATVADLGFIAKHRNGSLGFAVFAGGGLGAASRVAGPFEACVPASEAHWIAESVKRVFDKHGNRKNRHKARLRFLIDKTGMEGFRKLYETEMAELRKSPPPEIEVRALPERERAVIAREAPPGEGFAGWREKNVSVQKQEGYRMVQIPLALGDIPADELERLADVVEQHGEGMTRTTQWQNLLMRWIHEDDLIEVHAKLNALGLARPEPPVLRNLVSCAGASTCKLGICLSRGLATAIRRALEKNGAHMDELGDLKIHVSGCPNACGRHPVADIGLHGAARRVKGRLVPHYVLQLGGRVAEGETRLARGRHTIPARNIPALVIDLLEAFRESDQYPDFGNFLEVRGERFVDELAGRYTGVPDFEEDKNYYFDWGADEIFSLAGRGPGECGAGVFDLIEVDLTSARDALSHNRLFDATVLAARSLLVTRGRQADDESEALSLFIRHFIDEGLVDESLRALVEKAARAAQDPEPGSSFALDGEEVAGFVETIRKLYNGMDPSLRFKPVKKAPTAQTGGGPAPGPPIDREVDFRGVTCPLNYVKTKMVLEKLGSGAVLAVLLDADGARNVPESVRKDGHEVLSVEQEGRRWRVLIRKS
jgi:sulfite reductase (ferredoxin)